MTISRRVFGKMAAAMPFVGRQVGEHLAGPRVPRVGIAEFVGGNLGQQPMAEFKPLMSHAQAMRLILKTVPELAEQVRTQYYEDHRRITYIDPDIDVYRSFSTAAKIVYQRQRDVERSIAEITTEHLTDRPYYKRLQDSIKRYVFGA